MEADKRCFIEELRRTNEGDYGRPAQQALARLLVGQYTRFTLDKAYEVRAVALLRADPALADAPRYLWAVVMEGMKKTPNQQMDVVIALWRALL